MQFHHHGYVSGDPRVQPAAGVGLTRPVELPETMDVLVVGSGPAGIIAAAQLSQFPTVTTRIIERRDSRLPVGQADGIQARSVETFQAFGFADRIVEEAFRITEMAFWKPDPEQPERIARAAITPDDEHGMSEFPHITVNQSRVIDYFAEFARNSPTRGEIDYGYEFVGLEIEADHEYPVRVELRRTGDAAEAPCFVRAKYVVGADGARSAVRRAIGGRLEGEQAMHAWGVADVLAVTDFPDVRKKCAIQSRSGGNILLIPREGGYLFRLYVDLGELDERDEGRVRRTPIESIIDRARTILHPYELDVREVSWHSVYEVAHRLTDRFDDSASSPDGTPRVFLMGDASHTHSAKAGQGMNVSMQDGWNLGWKLGLVLAGRSPEALVRSYAEERREIASDLIDFDREWSTLMAKRPEDFESPSELEDFYVATAEFPFGFMTRYRHPLLAGNAEYQGLAEGFPIGKRFTSARTTRVADGLDAHIGHHHRADGRFRIYAFADAPGTALAEWARWMSENDASPIRRFTPRGEDIDALFDIKAVYQQGHHDVALADVPDLFMPESGPYRLIDTEKVYAALPGEDIFELRSIDRGGVVVLVRPDQYVAHVLPLSAPQKLAEFLTQIFIEQ